MRESLWSSLLNLIYPRKCAACKQIISDGALCESCEKTLQRLSPAPLHLLHAEGIAQTNAVFCYMGAGAALMKEFKFYRQCHCYELLLRQPFEEYAQIYYKEYKIDMIVPVPMYHAEKRTRGFNQAEYIAQRLARRLGLPCNAALLQQTRKSAAQHALPAFQRVENVRGVYCAAKGCTLTGKNILLVDDIVTTGATLSECAAVLCAAGAARVYAVAVMAAMDQSDATGTEAPVKS